MVRIKVSELKNNPNFKKKLMFRFKNPSQHNIIVFILENNIHNIILRKTVFSVYIILLINKQTIDIYIKKQKKKSHA